MRISHGDEGDYVFIVQGTFLSVTLSDASFFSVPINSLKLICSTPRAISSSRDYVIA